MQTAFTVSRPRRARPRGASRWGGSLIAGTLVLLICGMVGGPAAMLLASAKAARQDEPGGSADGATGVRAAAFCIDRQASVKLTWKPATSRYAERYLVLRSAAAGGPYAEVAMLEDRASRSFTDRTVVRGATYFYVVKSMSIASERASAEVSASTSTGC